MGHLVLMQQLLLIPLHQRLLLLRLRIVMNNRRHLQHLQNHGKLESD